MKLEDVFYKCTIIVDGQECLLPGILQDNCNFILDCLDDNDSRSVSLSVLTPLMPIAASIMFALYCLVHNDRTVEDVICHFPKDTPIIYQDSRAIFREISADGFAIIEQAGAKKNGSIKSSIPPSKFHLISPYYGEATSLDKRGVRSSLSKIREFIAELLQIDETEVPIEIGNSIVILADRSVANRVMTATLIKLPSGRILPIGELFPSAYYTEGGVYSYSGNAAKVEPVLKFTGRDSIARELIIEDTNKKILGLIVCESDIARIAESELNDFVTRRSLRHLCILGSIESTTNIGLLQQHQEIRLFAWTEFLLKKYADTNQKFIPNSLSEELDIHIKALCRRVTSTEILAAPISCEKYLAIKKALWEIANFDYTDTEKELFVIIGFSLIKLFSYSVTTMQQIEQQASKSSESLRSPSEQLKKLKSISDEFSGILLDNMSYVISELSDFYETLCYDNGKSSYLFDRLIKSSGKDRIFAITPKESYGSAFISSFTPRNKIFARRICFYTPRQYLKANNNEQVICTGALKNDELYRCAFVSNAITVLLYEFEVPVFEKTVRQINFLQSYYNERNPVAYRRLATIDDTDGDLIASLDNNLEEYVNTAYLRHAICHIPDGSCSSQSTVEISRILIFETTESAFLTKNYIAYCLDEAAETVVEKRVEDIQSGDYLVFNSYGNEAADIVDDLLQGLVDKDGDSGQLATAYANSKRWKNLLKRYMRQNDMSYRDVSESMASIGHPKHEVTIRTWLNEGSHIVGPRDADSFVAIALISDDEQLMNEPEKFWEACNFIRATRIRILKYLGVSMLNMISHKRKKSDDVLAMAIGDVTQRVKVLRVDDILNPDGLKVPIHMSNRLQQTSGEGQ